MTRTQKIVIAIGIAVLFCLCAAGVVLGLVSVGWRQVVRAGNEAAAIQSMKSIAAVEIQYYNTHNRRFGTLAELANEYLLDARFRGEVPVVDGYTYLLTINKTAGIDQLMYALNADPNDNSTGRNHFYLDSNSDEIRVNPDHRAGPNDPKLKK